MTAVEFQPAPDSVMGDIGMLARAMGNARWEGRGLSQYYLLVDGTRQGPFRLPSAGEWQPGDTPTAVRSTIHVSIAATDSGPSAQLQLDYSALPPGGTGTLGKTLMIGKPNISCEALYADEPALLGHCRAPGAAPEHLALGAEGRCALADAPVGTWRRELAPLLRRLAPDPQALFFITPHPQVPVAAVAEAIAGIRDAGNWTIVFAGGALRELPPCDRVVDTHDALREEEARWAGRQALYGSTSELRLIQPKLPRQLPPQGGVVE